MFQNFKNQNSQIIFLLDNWILLIICFLVIVFWDFKKRKGS
jgi:hypothetical protein